LILALLLVTGPIAAFTPQVHAVTASVTAELTAISPLTDIDASIYNLETPPTPSPAGQSFTVEIHLRDAANVQGVEVRLDFTAILAHAHNVSFVDKLGQVGGVLNSPVLEAVAAGFYDAGVYKVAAASTGAAWTQADGLIAILTFTIDSQPSGILYEPDFVGALHFTFTDVSDPVPAPIDHVNVDGQLKIDASPFDYPPSPYIFVNPASHTGTLGEIFTVSIMISADPFWDIAGYDVTFTYDPTLLSVVAMNEGNFLKQHGEATYGWFDNTTTPGQVWSVFAKLSDATPSGGVDSLFTVDLAVIFEASSYPPPGCVLGLINTDLASWAHPERTTLEPWMGRITAVQIAYMPLPIPVDTPWFHYTIDGAYTAPFLIPGPNIDLYTQYPNPYGGQGQGEHSDAFAPQQLVCLYAKVTYAGDRVTNKLVTFEIHDALGNKVTILENYSDLNGIAKVCFRIPQTDMIPGGEDPAIFGWWWVIATVELDQVVVQDNMTFQVGWLVEVDSVTPVGAPYAKYTDSMVFTVVWHTISEQDIYALLTVDPFDAQTYPIGEAYWDGIYHATRVGGYPGDTTGGSYSNTVTIGIPTWARIGLCTVNAVALTNFPRLGGTAYCPMITAPFGMTL
jgi:hypothetical protein